MICKGMVLKGFHQIIEKKRIKLFRSYKKEYEHGEQKRDFLYVEDAVKMTLHIIFNKCKGIYNIGSGITHSWNDLARYIFHTLELPISIEYVSMPDNLKNKYQYYTKANIKKLLNTNYKETITPLKDTGSTIYKFFISQNKKFINKNEVYFHFFHLFSINKMPQRTVTIQYPIFSQNQFLPTRYIILFKILGDIAVVIHVSKKNSERFYALLQPFLKQLFKRSSYYKIKIIENKEKKE